MYIEFNPPEWLVGVAVLPATAEIHPHLAGWRVLMSSPDHDYIFHIQILQVQLISKFHKLCELKS